MVFEYEIQPLLEWLFRNPDNLGGLGALWLFLAAAFLLLLSGTFLGYVAAAFRHGPFEAFYVVAKVLANAVPDLFRMSPRRISALAWLAIKESLRNRVLVVFAVFSVILLFGGWYLNAKSDHPATLYLGFVLGATNLLTLTVALILSALSLPADIKNRTIYTIVTKPVRAGEIVLGRVVGFGTMGTLLLAVMYIVSFCFVFFGLRHSHEMDAKDLVEIAVGPVKKTGDSTTDGTDKGIARPKQGTSSITRYHSHTVTVRADGRAFTDAQQDHKHSVRKVGEGESAKYMLDPGAPLPARVPLLGKLEFLDRTGSVRTPVGRPGAGVNVGHEWEYRKYIEGGTPAAAIWTFQNVTPEKFPNGLPLELGIRVFRSHKGRDLTKRVTGQIIIKHPSKNLQTTPIVFESAEYSVQEIEIRRDRPLVGSDGKKAIRKIKQDGVERDVDLFKDLVENGKVEVWLQCVDPGQYFGMAQADVYLRLADGSFALNLFKAHYSIWLQMMLVICFGVMSSTFLTGAVAMMATVSTLLIGLFNTFIVDIFKSLVGTEEQAMGGGPIESLIRIVTQKGVVADLDLPAIAVSIIQAIDVALFSAIWLGASVLPNFGRLDTSELAATGYDVSGGLLLQHTLSVVGYLLVVSVLGYFFFRTKEIAA